MHSFQPSRGRIFFEVLCVLTFAASFAVAWLQTKASAFLPLVAVSLLYALIHLFDMRRRPMAEIEAAAPQRIDFAPEPQVTRVAEVEEVAPMALVEPQPIAAAVPDVEPGEAAEPAAARSDAGRRKGGSRKGGGRRAGAPKRCGRARAASPADVLIGLDA